MRPLVIEGKSISSQEDPIYIYIYVHRILLVDDFCSGSPPSGHSYLPDTAPGSGHPSAHDDRNGHLVQATAYADLAPVRDFPQGLA